MRKSFSIGIVLLFVTFFCIASPVNAEEACSTVGSWMQESHGVINNFYADGTCDQQIPGYYEGPNTGTWVQNGNAVTIHWNFNCCGYPENFIDYTTLSDDCNTFTGVNQYGASYYGSRISSPPLTLKVWTEGHFIEPSNGEIWTDQGFVPIHVQVFKGSQPYQGATIITTDSPKGEEWGTTDQNGNLDLKYPLDTLYSEVRSLTFTVKAKGNGISGESEPIKIFDSTMKTTSQEITPAIKNKFDKIIEQKFWQSMSKPSIDIPGPQWLGVLDSFLQTLVFWFGEVGYKPDVGDHTIIETFKYTAQDTVPVYRIHEVQTRGGVIILEHNAWTEDQITYERALLQPILNLAGEDVTILSPAVPYVRAPDGSHAGYNPGTGILFTEFPMAIGEPGDEPFLMYIPNPQKGNYVIDVIGTGTGPYTLSIESTNSEGIPGQPFSYTGQTTAGKIDTFISTLSESGVITIQPPNQPPNLVNPGDQTLTEGKTISLNLVATDPDNDALTYSFTSTKTLPGASISGNIFTWTPGSGSAGTYSVTFNVTNSGGLSDRETIKITVNAAVMTVQSTVKIIPKTINLGSKGYFLAFVTLPEAYKSATIDMNSVSCSGAPAVRMIRLKIFPRIVGFVFKTSDLKGVELGNKVAMTVKGELKNNGKTYTFRGSDSVKVISKPTWQPDDIKDVSKVSDDQLFNKFNI